MLNNLRALLSQSFIGLAVFSQMAVLAQPSSAETIAGQSGNVRAEISYDKPEEYQYKNVRLQISRAGKTILDKKLPQESEYDRPVGDFNEQENKLPVVDLDGDKEPEIVADFFTGGAHCCTYSLIYRYDKKSQKYAQIRHEWGNGGYRFNDVDKDGLLEFESRDDRFAYAFTAYAASAYPLQIWQYRQGKMVNVTRRYPKLIYSHAADLWKTYTEIRQQGDDGKGFLAAYIADKYLLGQGEDGWKRVRQAYTKSDASGGLRQRNQYFADVRKFLRETGYIK
ncbi:hypothetical protein H6G76_08985 [Nostoc sp. FACHB-152]|uniref:hypothetical protein n=1 Tax=unclassified Nostoc TaxID=2593658 RepID=UPI001688DA9B|nr:MULTISPECIES: hypothetical protein [unclassified Nostoc]MBD2447299.1 hypothetical protein [Nostoc sp. FACHB-152]MBD2468100.1 hypothetical protein [Nostoc sp. FACHB-145]